MGMEESHTKVSGGATVSSIAHKNMPSGKSSKGRGHPLMFGYNEALLFDPFPDGGGFPKGFLKIAFQDLGVTDQDKVLHLCSGSVKSGYTIDIRIKTKPKIVADVRCLPFKNETFMWAIADPPYSKEYAENLYDTGETYPSPLSVMKEMGRVLKTSGRCGFLHHQVPFFRKPLKLLFVRGISQGLGFALKAWSVFEKEKDDEIE